ncbi:osmolarity sensor protein EnvZ [Rhizobium leguminosarum]|nr:osmolarity sensor protein EnvZ [Rhizobium ruizarguesonis]NEJ39762.1 osmolarity sensor protein EnvZ [Rhizobium ruizarguesonis]
MRRLLPRTLPAWLLIILITVLLASQTTLFLIMSRDRVTSSEIVDLYRLNERAFWLAKLLSPHGMGERKRLSSELADSTVVVNLSSLPGVGSPVATTDTLAELEDILVARLSRFNVQDARVRLDPPLADAATTAAKDVAVDEAGEVEEDLSEVASDFLKSQRYTVSLQFSDGQWLNFVTPVTPVAPLLSPESLPTYLVISAIVVLVAFWAVWRITAPYQLLEAAVARLGEDLNSPPVTEIGSKDFRSAARALNQTQARLREHVEERELLAAALAHDLRTPVTRMRLRLALVRSSTLERSLARDIADIEETVQSVIDLAKLDAGSEPVERIDFWAMVDAIADEYDHAVLETQAGEVPRLICTVPSVALRRAIRNLVENAIKYGKRANLKLEFDATKISLIVSDEGDGIPPAELSRVFKPFVRLEQSRNRQTGGSGLGLTTARNLIRKMGGDITLESGQQGGLRARLTVSRTTPQG